MVDLPAEATDTSKIRKMFKKMEIFLIHEARLFSNTGSRMSNEFITLGNKTSFRASMLASYFPVQEAVVVNCRH